MVKYASVAHSFRRSMYCRRTSHYLDASLNVSFLEFRSGEVRMASCYLGIMDYRVRSSYMLPYSLRDKLRHANRECIQIYDTEPRGMH